MTTLFIGLGKMGEPMVRQLARDNDVVLFDVGPNAATLAAELGTTALASLAELPGAINTVILMVPNSKVVESILVDDDRLLEKLPEGSLVIDMSSSVPASTRTLAAVAAARNIDYVDAPVSGGQAKAITGELAVIVGGTPEAIARALPLIEPMAGNIIAVGPAGAGHAAKALNNLLSATNIAAAAEILSVSTTFGIDPAVMVDVINASTGRSQASEVKYPKHILTGTYDSNFAMDLMIKDLGIARDLADEAELVTPVTAAAYELAKTARASLNRDDLDHTELARYYETENRVSFRPLT
jgi:3-hydroxyisobutyrate dehydrogenase